MRKRHLPVVPCLYFFSVLWNSYLIYWIYQHRYWWKLMGISIEQEAYVVVLLCCIGVALFACRHWFRGFRNSEAWTLLALFVLNLLKMFPTVFTTITFHTQVFLVGQMVIFIGCVLRAYQLYTQLKLRAQLLKIMGNLERINAE